MYIGYIHEFNLSSTHVIFALIDLKKKTGVYWQQIYNGGIV